MFNKLRTVVYRVDDLQKAKEWYKEATGIDPYYDEPYYVGFDINGCELGLDPDGKGVSKGNQSVAYWSVDDIRVAEARLLGMGAISKQAITNVGGPIEVAELEDPFGNSIGLICGA